ncbi:hypothetical protein [Streptomyces sp. YU58]|uniref:hypothetical protein n=1 Tax=Streptomyces sp. SX92 TaxID=3158972 RepID=UPI0027B91DAE|nr:hypothetical protein [Streptomyces coralus]WLW55868.1 hypothetical protein QU709_33005 [Streptomyces coralus]
MVLPSWKNMKPGSPRGRPRAKPFVPVPEMPVEQTADRLRAYAERDPIPHTAVTRQIAAAVHDRPHRLKQLKAVLGRQQDRARGRRSLRRIPQLGPYAGEQLAHWALREVLFADKRPVPSYGFELAPVLSHCVAARRQQRIRAALLVAVVVLTGLRYPFGVAALASVALLHMWFRGGRVSRILRWGTTSIVSFVLLGLAVLAVYRLAGTYAPVLRLAMRQGGRAALLLALVVTVVYALDRWVAWGYVLAVRPGRPEIGDRPHAAPLSARRIAAIKVTETWQTIAYQRYRDQDRFVGAGPAWPKGSSRIQLKSAGAGDEEDAEKLEHPERDGLRDFEADELMDQLREELERLREHLIETHSLPNCDVSEMFGVSELRWKDLPTGMAATWPEAGDMLRDGRDAPSSMAARRYLAAQVISWDGEIVVTVFAHAAMEGRTLHFVTRPHVIRPLRKEMAVAAPTGRAALAGHLLLVPLHAVGDAVDLAQRTYQVVRRSLPLTRTEGVRLVRVMSTVPDDEEEEKKPVSLREHCSRTDVDDMHQWEDALRHVSILQTWMFARVRVFLDEHGADLGEFDKQVSTVINNTIVTGDKNTVLSSAAGGDSSQTSGPGKAPAEPNPKG